MTDVRRSVLKAITIVGGFSLFLNVLVLIVPLYSLQIYDRVLSSQSVDTLLWLTVVAVLGILVLAMLDGLRSRILVRVSGWLERRLAPVLLVQNLRNGAGKYGALATQGLEDVAALRRFLTGPGAINLFDAPWMPLYLVVIFLLHPWLGAAAAIGAGLLIATGFLNEIATRRLLSSANAANDENLAVLRTTLQGADAVRALGMTPAVMSRWRRGNEAVLGFQADASDRSAVIQSFARFLRLAVQVAVVGLGALLAIDRQLTPGALIAAAIIVSRALAPAEGLIGNWRSVVGARGAYRRILQRLANVANAARTRLPPPLGRLDVENVGLTVPGGDRAILSGIRFALAAGDGLAIIGPSAAGKSSLARVILGITPPSSGTVRLDGADIHTWDPDLLGRHLGYLPQDVRLFPGTVAENVARLGVPDDAMVIEAARFAGAHEMILRLPRGYDTEIDPTSPMLSGGQRQLIALARAFYGRPSLVLLDEPNSNLDRDGEASLMGALARAKEVGITVVVIAHRLGVLSGLEKVLVLRDGRMAMLGPRAEVMAKLTSGVVAPLRRPVAAPRADVSNPA